MEKPSFFPSPFQPSRPISSFSFLLSLLSRGPENHLAGPFPLPLPFLPCGPKPSRAGPSPFHGPLRLPSLTITATRAPPVRPSSLPCAARTRSRVRPGHASPRPSLGAHAKQGRMHTPGHSGHGPGFGPNFACFRYLIYLFLHYHCYMF